MAQGQRTLTIVGDAGQAFEEIRGESWVCNTGYRKVPHASAVFEMHTPEWLRDRVRDEEHLEWLSRNQPCIVWAQEAYPQWPSSRRYPIEEVCAVTGLEPEEFVCSASYMLGMAVVMVRTGRLILEGISLMRHDDLGGPRRTIEMLIGFARGRGWKVEGCEIDTCDYRYGYDDEKVYAERARIAQEIAGLSADGTNAWKRLDDLKRRAERLPCYDWWEGPSLSELIVQARNRLYWRAVGVGPILEAVSDRP